MIRFFIFLFLFGFFINFPVFSQNLQENLPLLIDGKVEKPYEILTPVGSTKKTIEEAKVQLLREAKKVDAEAVINVVCTPGGLIREGLTLSHELPYCRGKAIRFLKSEK